MWNTLQITYPQTDQILNVKVTVSIIILTWGHNKTSRCHTDWMSQLKWVCCASTCTELVQQGSTLRGDTRTWLGVCVNGVTKLYPTLVHPFLALQWQSREENPHARYHGERDTESLPWLLRSLFCSPWIMFRLSYCPPVNPFAIPNCNSSHLLGLSRCECWKLGLTSWSSSKICPKSKPKRKARFTWEGSASHFWVEALMKHHSCLSHLCSATSCDHRK